jgi:hypothetical protein
MNAPTNDDLRSLGGRMRDEGRPEWEKKFMGALAGSSRPLKKNHPASADPKLAVEILKSEATRFPWSMLFLVGRDGRTVRSTLSEADAVARTNQMGGAIGLAGYLFLRDRFTPFLRPFISGMDVERRLKAIVQQRWEEAQELIRLNEEENSPASATVYTDGKNFEYFVSWQPARRKPPKDWELAGVVYFVADLATGTPGAPWRAKARATDEKWQAAMEQAMRRLEAEVKPLTRELNKAGLSLQDLPAFVALINQPGLLKDLEKKLR